MPRSALRPVVRQLRGFAVAPEYQGATDAELLARFADRRDEAAFAALLGRHGRLIWSVCRQATDDDADAEDAFQAAFLVLARKAGSIRAGVTVASWLYRVAYRIAMKARIAKARRRRHEAKAGPPAPRPAPCGVAWAELQAALQEELDRLPEQYRTPFVLCCLEGRTRADVARELGWKDGTVASRLDRARRRLQDRLARRGIALTAALAALTLAEAEVSAALLAASAEAGVLFAASRAAAAGHVSARVLSLAEGALRSMAMTNAKLAASAVLLLSTLLLGAGLAVGAYGGAGEAGIAPSASTGAGERRVVVRYRPVDLQARATQKLTDNFGSGREGNNLAALPTGEQTFARVPFHVGTGILQLGSEHQKERRPDRVDDVKIDRPFARLHVLHATGYGNGSIVDEAPTSDDPLFIPDGTRIAEYRLHYADGGLEVLPVVYGKDVRDWWFTDRHKDVTRGKGAWVGDNPLARKFDARVRLYLNTWENPRPKARVTHLDYVKVDGTPAAPFCVAITLEE